MSTAVLAAGVLFAIGGGGTVLAASANEASTPVTTASTGSTAAPVVAAEAVTTLPLFGVPLTVDVSTTPSGTIASVAVNPATGLTANKVRPNRVAFVNDTATGTVRVQTRHGGENVDVRAGSLADISGTGGWSGDVFGTGATTKVAFTIGAQPDGSPDITAITVSDPSAVIGSVRHGSGDHGQFAGATITFTSGIQTRRLTISVFVVTRDGASKASSSVSLSRISGTSLPSDQIVGAHTWSGMLCDGSTANVGYTVAADGTITAGTITPATATSKASGHSLDVTFSTHESLHLTVGGRDAGMRISANPRLRCAAGDPTVNTPTSTTAPGDHGGHDGHGGPGNGGSGNGGTGNGGSGSGNGGTGNGGRSGGGSGGHGTPGH